MVPSHCLRGENNTKEGERHREKRISNIEQGISNYEVEIAALGFASLAMTGTRLRVSYAAAGEGGGQKGDRSIRVSGCWVSLIADYTD